LRQYFPTVKELQKDAVYEIPVLLPTKYNITIRITIGANFPNSPPDLVVFPQVTHPLIDSSMRIRPEASSKLAEWHVHQNLGKTMYSIVQKLMTDPPKLGAPEPGASNPMPIRKDSHGSQPHLVAAGSNSAREMRSSASSSSSVSIPPIPDEFPELSAMKPAQLGELLNDDAAFKLFLNNIDSVKTMRSLRDDLRIGQSGGDTSDLDQELATLEADLSNKKKQLNLKLQQQEKMMEKLQVSNLVDALAKLAAEIEEESDQVSRKFLDSDIDLKAFLDEFTPKRHLFHLRSAKKESLLLKQQREKGK